MCEILVCVKDRDAASIKAGTVITVQENGHGWGDAELGRPIPGNPHGNHPFFRVIKLPKVSVEEAMTKFFPQDETISKKAFDKNKIHPVNEKAFKDHWEDDSRIESSITLQHTINDIDKIVSDHQVKKV